MFVAKTYFPRGKEYVISHLYPQHIIYYLKHNCGGDGGRVGQDWITLERQSKVYLENTKAFCLKSSEQEKDSKIEKCCLGLDRDTHLGSQVK